MTSISKGSSQDVDSYLSISCLDTEMDRRTMRLIRVLFCSYDTPFFSVLLTFYFYLFFSSSYFYYWFTNKYKAYPKNSKQTIIALYHQ